MGFLTLTVMMWSQIWPHGSGNSSLFPQLVGAQSSANMIFYEECSICCIFGREFYMICLLYFSLSWPDPSFFAPVSSQLFENMVLMITPIFSWPPSYAIRSCRVARHLTFLAAGSLKRTQNWLTSLLHRHYCHEVRSDNLTCFLCDLSTDLLARWLCGGNKRFWW